MRGPFYALGLYVLVSRGAALRVGADGAAAQGGGSSPWRTEGLGKRGFRTLGKSCWDSNVWEDQELHLTRAMCAKTRAYRSSSRSAEKVLRMLHQGQCLTVVAIGSSMTFGNCFICWNLEIPNRHVNAWPGQFKRWLDVMFPCNDPQGHTVHNLATAASDSGYWSMQVNVWRGSGNHSILDADMVFVDTSVTDVQDALDTWPALSMPPQHQDDLILPNTELLIRELKTLPKRPWIIYAELNWKQTFDAHLPGHWDAILSHLPVLKHYDIDQVSYLDAFLPIGERKTAFARRWLQIDGGHPSYLGHQVLAQVMAHTLMEESHFMNLEPLENDGIVPFRDEDSSGLPEPLWVEKTRATLYEQVDAVEVIPYSEPFKLSFEVLNFTWWGGRITATSQEHAVISWIVDLPLRGGRPRPLKTGYVSLGFRKTNVGGLCHIRYHVLEGGCRADEGAPEYAWGLQFNPFWGIPSSLRTNKGFEFAVPDNSSACIILRLEWFGEPGYDPMKFQVDDLTVLA